MEDLPDTVPPSVPLTQSSQRFEIGTPLQIVPPPGAPADRQHITTHTSEDDLAAAVHQAGYVAAVAAVELLDGALPGTDTSLVYRASGLYKPGLLLLASTISIEKKKKSYGKLLEPTPCHVCTLFRWPPLHSNIPMRTRNKKSCSVC